MHVLPDTLPSSAERKTHPASTQFVSPLNCEESIVGSDDGLADTEGLAVTVGFDDGLADIVGLAVTVGFDDGWMLTLGDNDGSSQSPRSNMQPAASHGSRPLISLQMTLGLNEGSADGLADNVASALGNNDGSADNVGLMLGDNDGFADNVGLMLGDNDGFADNV
eukprot:3521709-Ditylum_brightwellii.AAC.1